MSVCIPFRIGLLCACGGARCAGACGCVGFPPRRRCVFRGLGSGSMANSEMFARIKARLLGIGRWGDYIAAKEELKARGERGVMRKAMESVAPELVAEFFPRAARAAAAAGASSAPGASAPVASASSSAAPAPSAPSVPFPPTAVAVDASVFEGKRCSMTDAILWAYEKSAVDGVAPEDAPSALAWCLLVDFRRSVSYKQDLFKGVAVAKARREETVEGFGEGEFDGSAEYDILARLGGSEARGADIASASSEGDSGGGAG